MIVSQIAYKRYTIEEGRAAFEEVKALVADAKDANGLLKAKKVFDDAFILYSTACSLANCRFTLDTRDEFYSAEVEYYDGVSPYFSELYVAFLDMDSRIFSALTPCFPCFF